MPTLSKERETKEIELPKSGGEVTVYSSIKAEDINKINTRDIHSADDFNPTAMIGVLIKEWNFTDEDGNDLEPNEKNVGLLDIEDFTALVDELDMEDFLDEESQVTEK